jgi:hypothetical protein
MTIVQPAHDASDLAAVRDYMSALQARIAGALEGYGERPFRRDEWRRAEGGGGVSMSLEDGEMLARASSFRTSAAARCRRPQRRTGQSSLAAHGKPSAFRWCCIRAIRTYPSFISTCAFFAPRRVAQAAQLRCGGLAAGWT